MNFKLLFKLNDTVIRTNMFAIFVIKNLIMVRFLKLTKEFNEILDNVHIFNDRCLLRRELFNKDFIGQLNDDSKYWLEEKQPKLEDFNSNKYN